MLNIIKIDDCIFKVKYEADKSVIKEKIDEIIYILRNNDIPGFKKGKATNYAIKTKYKKQIIERMTYELINYAIDEITFENNFKLIGKPNINNTIVDFDNFSCEIDLLIKPEVKLNKYHNFTIIKPKPLISVDNMVERSIENIRLKLSLLKPYDENDVVELSDEITFSYTTVIDGEIVPEYTAVGELYVVGTNKWKEWDQHLLGMKAGEDKEFDFIFSNSEDVKINNKNAIFKISLLMGVKKKIAEMDENFFKTIGIKNEEVLRKELKNLSEHSLKLQETNFIKNKVMNLLIQENLDFKIPNFIINNEINNIMNKSNLEFSKLLIEEQEKIKRQANANARLSLILDSIREEEPNSIINDIQLRDELDKILQSRNTNVDTILKIENGNIIIQNVVLFIKDEYTLQWIIKNSIIEESV